MCKLPLKLTAVILAAALVAGGATVSYAEPVTKDTAQERMNEAEENLSEINDEISEIESRQADLEERIAQADAELVAVLIEIETTKADIETKEAELEEAEKELAEAREKEDAYLDSMSLRIQYLYENGDVSYLEALFTSGGFADVLNKIHYFNSMYEADRAMLKEYTEAREEREAVEQKAAEEAEALKDLESALEEQQEALEAELDEKGSSLKETEKALSEAEALAEEYQDTISSMNAVLSGAGTDYSTVLYVDDPVQAGKDVVEYASQFIGNRYVWGGESLTDGCDCSGFVKSVYAHFGAELPKYSGSQRSVGYAVSESEMREGDIVCYEGHVGIYAGNGRIINAANKSPYPRGGIKYSPAHMKKIVCVRRIFA